MQVYKKILVAMDCSPVDDVIIEHVSALAIQNNAEVWLLHVVHSHTLDQDRVLRERAEACLQAWSARLKERSVMARVLIRSGEPDKEILQEIEGKDYDLVAMATHGHRFIADILFGSVSQTVKHNISIPLLLIGPRR
ncbi:MAG: universal stress protein [Candidatus Hydrogenedentes bacterium]|nr:universal stress protein [Candidatus Hydrogenedentota bacterium]